MEQNFLCYNSLVRILSEEQNAAIFLDQTPLANNPSENISAHCVACHHWLRQKVCPSIYGSRIRKGFAANLDRISNGLKKSGQSTKKLVDWPLRLSGSEWNLAIRRDLKTETASALGNSRVLIKNRRIVKLLLNDLSTFFYEFSPKRNSGLAQ